MTPGPETKTRILEVAEELFGDQGLDRVSIRDITDAAQANIAAVNYHFGSKEKLIEAVFERRIAPLNEARITALNEVEKAAGPKGPRTAEILAAFIRPALDCCLSPSAAGGVAFSKLVGRCLAETRPEVEDFLRAQFAPVAARFENAFLKALPHLSREDVFWRLKFTFGAFHHWLLTRERFLPDAATKTTKEAQVQKLIAFTAAGFCAK